MSRDRNLRAFIWHPLNIPFKLLDCNTERKQCFLCDRNKMILYRNIVRFGQEEQLNKYLIVQFSRRVSAVTELNCNF